jgi:glycosyltransferase involved in cell wall biosynthesis
MGPMVTVCTSISSSTSAAAQVLAASVREHNPDAHLLAMVSDSEVDATDWDEVIEAGPKATTPEVLRLALQDSGAALYLAPQVRLYASLEPVWSALSGATAALFARARSIPDDGKLPGDGELLACGRITPRAVGLTNGAPAEALLNWWAHRIAEHGQDRPWLDLAGERFPAVSEVSDAGCNVSYWNLHERRLTNDNRGALVDGVPLRFVDFDGFRADRPYWLSDAANRVLVTDDPVLSELCGAYAEQLRVAGWSPPRRGLIDVERLGNSQRVDHLVKSLWDRALLDGEDLGDPLNAIAADAFVAWMRRPAERGGTTGVNRYLFAAYETRPDLQEAFPDLEGPDGARLVRWAWEHGRREVLGELLPPPPERAKLVQSTELGVNVIGYLGETLGLAEAARLYILGLRAAGIPVSTTAVTPDLPVKESSAPIERYGSRSYVDLKADQEPAFNLACLNGDHLAELLRKRGDGILANRPTIGQWGWETDVLPPSWTAAFEHVEEVWVYSTFVAENLGRLLPMPVVVVPPPIVVPQVDAAGQTIIRDGRFTFLGMLDLFSTLQRKNPLGLIEAFTRGFAPGEGPRLIVKTINARFRTQAAEELRYAAGGHPDVEFVDDYLEPRQKSALIARADCYVSLHRSEGFGLPLAEAMALGTPVIATGYSGNTDFTTPFNSYLVDFAPTNVGPDCEIYPPHGTWAEPDLDHAAELMRRVWQHPQESSAKAQRARAEIVRDYAPKVVGEIARGRLERLSDLRAASAANGPRRGRETSAALARAEQAMSFDLREGMAPVPSGPAGVIRKLVLRLILPFTHHERQVDRALLDAVRELRADLDCGTERARGDGRD